MSPHRQARESSHGKGEEDDLGQVETPYRRTLHQAATGDSLGDHSCCTPRRRHGHDVHIALFQVLEDECDPTRRCQAGLAMSPSEADVTDTRSAGAMRIWTPRWPPLIETTGQSSTVSSM